jgi:hypothetical protein
LAVVGVVVSRLPSTDSSDSKVRTGLPVPYRRIYVYVTKFEYVLVGPPMFFAALAIGISFAAAALLANALKNSD